MIFIVEAHDSLVREPLICLGCREPVTWRGRWVHITPSTHEARAAEHTGGWCSQ